ncbi:MAG TPA: hypothetical protein VD815_07920 [Candidatus Saccharimonadales bacterium]|nr:hypothetical protein [Candidatus Saccharimonadales bacterium]
MNTVKEFVTKIINKRQGQLIQRVKSLPKLLSIGLIAVLGLLPLASIPNRGAGVYAQQVQLQTTAADPWYQSLEIARSKVEAALSPEAYGHGVPGLQNLSTNEILMAIGITVMMSILAFMTVRIWLSHPIHTRKNDSIISYQK